MGTHRTGAALVAAIITLAACGSDDAPGAATGADATTGSSAPAGTAMPVGTAAPTATDPSATNAADTSTSGATTADTTADTVAADTSAADTIVPTETLDELVAQAESENTLVVYGNPSNQIWEPVLAAFAAAYPTIEVETFDLGGLESFQRYLSESSSGVATADLIVASEPVGWLDLVERGEVIDYVDAQLAELPEFARQAPGVYSMAVDPLVAMYNQFVIPPEQQPTSLAELAAMAADIDGFIGTVEIENSQAYTGNYGYLAANGEGGWATLETLGQHARAESGTGALLDKATSGEYPASFFVSGAVRLLIDTGDQGDVLDYQYLTDATPLVPRGMGVTAQGDSPASAKLLLHWLLSGDGQAAICLGGLTPYRDGVDCAYGYDAIADVVGEDHMIVANYEPAMDTERDAIQSRWNQAFGR